MPVQEIIEELKKLDKFSEKMNARIKQKREVLLEKLASCNDEDYDWISVKAAAKLRDVSPQAIYARADLEKRYFGSKISVRKSQVMAVNDVYERE